MAENRSEQPKDDQYLALQQAADWFATLNDDPDELTEAAWQEWLESCAQNQKAWRQIEKIAQRFEPLRDNNAQDAAGAAILTRQQSRTSRRKFIHRALVLTGGVGVASLGWKYPALTNKALAFFSDEKTGLGEIREVALADQTRIWLNSLSAINVDYQHSERRIDLVDGEVHIVTGDDANRPFYVYTRHGRLQALGTRFSVWQRGESSLLAVYEGAVEISTKSGASRILKQGQQVTFDAETIDESLTVETNRMAWTRGLLVAEKISLDVLVTELQRYYPGYIHLNPSVAQIEVMGTYPINEPATTLTMLTEALPVQINRRLKWFIEINPKK